EGIAAQLSEGFGVPRARMKTIYNGYPSERIRQLAAEPLPTEFATSFNRPTVVNVGSFIHQKGQEDLIRAVALARQQVPDIQLCLVGQGSRQAEYESLAKSLGIEDAILFVGFDTNPYRYVARSQVFVLPSRFEGFPNVLAEAMLCGLPVIATDCPTGPREILGASEHGILLPAITLENQSAVESEMAAAIVRLLTTTE